MKKKISGQWHHGDLRRVLLDESLRVIEKSGVVLLSLRDLAQKLGVSSGAPYHHFSSRDALLAALAEEGFEHLYREMARQCEGLGPDATIRLGALGKGYVKFAMEHPGYFRVMFMTIQDNKSAEALGNAAQKAYRLLEESVLACVKDGKAPNHSPEALVLLAWAAVHGIAQLWIDGPFRRKDGFPDRDYFENEIAQLVSRLYRAAAQRRLD